MAVRVVTDSSADLPKPLVEELGITVVPAIVAFGDESFRDGIDIDHETFYQRLMAGDAAPITSQPSPAQFAEAYAQIGSHADGIVSIHVSAALSGTCNSATQAARPVPCPIEILDSRTTSSGMGLVVIEAARVAQSGASFGQVLDTAQADIARSQMCFTLDTLEFLAKGGRIGKARRLLGTLLRIKPVLTVRNGVVEPLAQCRTQAQAIGALRRFVDQHRPCKALSVGYSTDRHAAAALADGLGHVFPKEATLLTRIGPAIGSHVGPGCLSVALLEDRA